MKMFPSCKFLFTNKAIFPCKSLPFLIPKPRVRKNSKIIVAKPDRREFASFLLLQICSRAFRYGYATRINDYGSGYEMGGAHNSGSGSILTDLDTHLS